MILTNFLKKIWTRLRDKVVIIFLFFNYEQDQIVFKIWKAKKTNPILKDHLLLMVAFIKSLKCIYLCLLLGSWRNILIPSYVFIHLFPINTLRSVFTQKKPYYKNAQSFLLSKLYIMLLLNILILSKFRIS